MQSRRLTRDVRDQQRPSLGRSIEFCVSSIRHRFFRSAVTLSVVVLAVAFLMNILTETIIAGSVARGVQREFEQLYIADLFDRRIAHETPVRSLVEELSALKFGSPRWRELERWSGLPPAEFAKLATAARNEVAYTAFFENLDFGRRRALSGRNEGSKIFDALSTEAGQQSLAAAFRSPEMATVSVPGDAPALLQFLRDWPAYRENLNRVLQSVRTVLDGADAKLKTPVARALDEAAMLTDPAQKQQRITAILSVLNESGFELSAGELAQVCDERRKLAVLRKFREYVQDAEFRSHWADLKVPGEFTPEILLQKCLDDPSALPWLSEHAAVIAARGTGPLPVSRDELLSIAGRFKQRVQQAGRSVAHLADGEVSKSEKQKKFIAYVSEHPQFEEAWKASHAGEEFSLESLLWSYNESAEVRRWLQETARTIGEKPPYMENDVRALADAYLNWVQKRGLQKTPLDAAAADDPKFAALAEYLNDPEYKATWDNLGIRIDFSPAAVILYCGSGDASLRVLSYIESVARHIAGRIKAPMPASEAELLDIARMERQRDRVRSMQAELSERGASADGIGERTFWLIAVSFLVCVVGIANAMLMAVTERFREIATMKCLGALDGFIMTIFLIESALQGFIGATIGVLLGFLLAVFRCGLAFGLYTTEYFPVLEVLKNIGVSTAAGMLLAILAAVYPAWVASRMAPMEAMRVE